MATLAIVLAVVQKELVRRGRDRVALALWLGIPLAIGGLISLALGGSSGPAPRAKVLVVDLDESWVSGFTVQALSSPRAQVFECEVVAEAEGRERIRAGEASALIVIPAGFGEALLAEEPTTLELVTNPSQRILPGIVREAANMLSEGVFYAHRILGGPLKEMAREIESGSGGVGTARIAAETEQTIRRVSPLVFPPVIELSVVEADADEGAGGPSLAQLYVPSVLVMALFFIAQGLSEDLWRERVLGTLRRSSCAPAPVLAHLAGKLAASAVIAFAVSLLGLAVAALFLGIEPARIPLAALWASAVCVVLTLAMMLLQMLASSQRAGGILTNAVLFPLLMLGGGLIPFEAMPDSLAAVGRWTPNGWGLDVLAAHLQGELGLERALTSASAALASGAVLFLLCALRLSRVFARA